MPRIIQDFNESYIGIVKGYNTITREIEAFIPKLMPAIPYGREDVTIKTNLAAIPSQYNISYNSNIKLTSTITVHAASMSEEMPKIGSKVYIRFIEGNPLYPFWLPWNYNGDYEIIDEEKYPKYFNLKIGDKEVLVNKDDDIEIILPEGYNVIKIDDKDNKKHKIIKIDFENDLTERVDEIEKEIGNLEFTRRYQDNFGNARYETIEASGIYKLLQTLDNEISFLKNNIVDVLPEAGKKYYGLTYILSNSGNDEPYICIKENDEYIWKKISSQSI